jgi:plastocyanin
MKNRLFSLLPLLVAVAFWSACGGGEKSEGVAKKSAGAAGEKAAGYSETTVTDGGTITGVVTYAGTAPAPEKIKVTKDVQACGKEEHYREDLIVGANKGIKNVVVKLTKISSGKPLASLNPDPVIDQRACVFKPHVLVMPVGGKLRVLNSDGILHNLHTYSEKNPQINTGQPGFKKEMSFTFKFPETIRVTCDVHPWMAGYVVVAEHPYYAVTDDEGKYSLTDVPAGTYTVEFWQESLGTQTQEVAVTAGQTSTLDLEFPAKAASD